VTTGLAADGFVEVAAADGGLSAGDLVVVGEDRGVPAGDDADAESEGVDEADG
jgi:hypothetical protein